MSTGIFFVSAKTLVSQPRAPPSLAVSKSDKDTGEQLHMYEYLQQEPHERPSGIALSVIKDVSVKSQMDFQMLKPLPPLSRDEEDDASTLQNEDSEVSHTHSLSASNEKPLPPELSPRAIDDDLPEGDPDNAIQDTDRDLDDLVDLKQSPDFDPNIPEYLMNDQIMVKDTLNSYDKMDMKNCDNWDPNQDPEARFFGRDVQGWIKSDIDECVKGAKPRLYERLAIQIKPLKGVIVSEDYDPSAISSTSNLSPYLLVYQIPCPSGHNANDQDKAFEDTFTHFAYLTYHINFRRISCFKQVQPSLSRWLVIQEFTQLANNSSWLSWKKREAEYWWRKRGWNGVLVEIFRLSQNQ